ncbi:hypothetical protein IBX73_03635 [candidate division WOR-3 bacterium]|nr:hypothetical protein [candidate division WOR-3 bacterium]
MHRYLSLFLLAALGSASVLITNGDFEQDLSVGWTQTINGANASIIRGTTYDPDPDYEVYVYKGTGTGHAKLHQTAHIPTTNLEFAASLKLYASSNSTTCWAAGALVIEYLDDLGDLLGETMICYKSSVCPWTNTPTRHIITPADSFWHDYAFNIDTELTNLSGVNPGDIKRIQITLAGFAESG